jgi:NitT/TauT family transport system ATP-binding protein
MLAMNAVTKRFATRHATVTALDGISLTVRNGEFVSLIGPSGCGKSTILRLATGATTPDAGTVLVDGQQPDAARCSKLLAFAPQSPALLPWLTVRDNARLLTKVNSSAGRGLDERSIDDLLATVGLFEFATAYPHELSGGMQQRVALVRAFATDAPLLLMDEPFASLDELTRAELRGVLAELCERRSSTVLFVTHSISEAVLLSDRVVVMSPRPGRIVAAHQIDLPHPRRLDVEDTDAFRSYVTTIRGELMSATS